MPRFKAIYYFPVIIAAALFGTGLVQMWQRVPPGNDFYAPYVGAQRLLAGLSPYGIQAAAALGAVWHDPFAEAGIAYPVPLLIFVLPFALLTFPVAALLWTTVGLGLGYFSAFVTRTTTLLDNKPLWHHSLMLMLPFVFWPFFRAVRLGQASALWFGLAALLILAIHNKQRWLVTICVLLLPLKPQTGLIFALYGAWWLYRHYWRGLLFTGILGSLLLAISLIMQPTWIQEWLAQVNVYKAFVDPPSMLPFVVPVLLAFWRLPKPWWVIAAILQAMLFPMSDIYSTLPILLAWYLLPAPIALVGASLSWLTLLMPAPNSALAVLVCIFAPLLLTALWQARPRTTANQPVPLMAAHNTSS